MRLHRFALPAGLAHNLVIAGTVLFAPPLFLDFELLLDRDIGHAGTDTGKLFFMPAQRIEDRAGPVKILIGKPGRKGLPRLYQTVSVR